MRLTNDDFTDSFSESVGTLESLQKSAITYLFSDPRLQLVKLSEQEYVQSQIAYRSHHNEQEIMLEATLQAIEKNMSSQANYTILSVGCGKGIFEEPFIKQLLSKNKTIHFVGEDPNQEACVKTQEWCQKLSTSQPTKFGFKIHPVGFESFALHQVFDIILSIHSLTYFSEIETSIRKIYDLLREGGIGIIGLAGKRQLLNEPYYHVLQRLYGQHPWHSEDIQKVLTECNIPFRQEKIEFLVNITECFQQDSELGKWLLDFMINANTAYFSSLQLRLLLDYFGTNSQKNEEGKIMLPHSGDLFFMKK